MKKLNNTSSEIAKELRRKAEDIVKKKKDVLPTTKAELIKLVQEFEVHQFELEMMNEELQKSRAEVEKSLEAYTDLYDFAPSAYITIDRNGTILKANLKSSSLLRTDRSQLLNRRIHNYLSKESYRKIDELISKAFQSKSKQNCEVSFNKYRFDSDKLSILNGDDKDLLLYAYIEAIVGEDSDELKLIMLDITERKWAQDQIEYLARSWQTTFNSIKDSIFLLDPNEIILQSNDASLSLFNLGEENILGKHCCEVVHNSQYPINGCPLLKAKLSKQRESMLLPINDKWFEVIIDPILDGMKNITGFVHIVSDITERKLAEEKIFESEVRYRRLHETMFDCHVQTDMSGKIMDVNHSYIEMLGYTKEELLSLTYPEITPHHWFDFEQKIVEEQILTKGYSDIYEKEYINKDGTVFPVEIRAYLLSDSDGNPESMWAIVRDITKRKKAEQALQYSEERYRLISSVASDYVFSSDVTDDGTLKLNWVSGSFEKITGYTFEEYTTQSGWFKSLHPGDIEIDKLDMENLKNNKQVITELRTIAKNGNIVWVRVYAQPVWDNKKNKLIGIYGAVQDITERKFTESALLKSRKEFQSYFDASSVGLTVTGSNKTWKEVNQRMCSMLGYTKSELTGHSWIEFTHPDDIDKNLELFNHTINGVIEKFEMDKRFIRKDGTIIFVILSAVCMRNEDGSIDHLLASYNNITERKLAEEALKENEERYRSLFVNMIEGFAYCKMLYKDGVPYDFEILKSNEKLITLTGLTDVDGKKASEVIPSLYKDNPEVFDICGRVASSGNPEHFETFVPVLNGWYAVSVYSTKKDHFVAMFESVTERKKNELALIKNRRFLADLIENSGTLIYVKDLEGRYELVNKKWEAITGLARNLVIGKIDYELFPDAVGIQYRKNDLEVMQFGKLIESEEMLIKDNITLYFISIKFPTFDKDGNINGICGISTEITERKLAEEALRESEDKYRTITDHISDVVWILDSVTERFTFVSPSVYNLLGYTVEEILEKPVYDVLTQESANLVKILSYQRITEFLDKHDSERTFINEVEQKCKDGSTVWTEVVTSIYKNEKTGNINIRGVTRNISERKKIQDALSTSEERFRSTLDNMLEGCQIIDSDWRYVYLNDSADVHNHRSKSELLGKRYMDVWPGIENSDVFRHIKKCMDTGVSLQFETEFTYPDGKVGWFDLSIQPVPEGVFILSIDISDRKKAEQEIIDSRENLRALTAKLEKVREEERLHLSRELHDHLGQNLTGLKMDVAYVEKRIRNDSKIDKATLLLKTKEMVDLIDDLIKNVRQIASELRPNVLDYLGLIPAIEWQIEEFTKRTEIECLYNSNTSKIDLGMEINSSIFRIIQEAFTNIIRHSKADKVDFSISDNGAYIVMEIQDNGIGIRSDVISNVKSLGILGMTERTLQFDGILQIKNASQGGTLLTLIIPKQGNL